MHGLIFRSFEGFIRFIYGDAIWQDVVKECELNIDSFEPMFRYDPGIFICVVKASARILNRSRDTLLEDYGTFLVTDPRSERVRRLLRFGGVDYPDFLHSLEDLHGRANLAVPDLNLPAIELKEVSDGEFMVTCLDVDEGVGQVLLGVLRALADDYGSLAFLEFSGRYQRDERLMVQVIQLSHGEARVFQLADGG